jgi:uncharacterized membrane protein YuzA (DUF378 family)
MENNLVRSILAGVVATAVMTVFMFTAPMMGFPEMNPADMMSGILGVSPLLGWVIYFLIGITFAAIYVYLFNPNIHIHSRAGKGSLMDSVSMYLHKCYENGSFHSCNCPVGNAIDSQQGQ